MSADPVYALVCEDVKARDRGVPAAAVQITATYDHLLDCCVALRRKMEEMKSGDFRAGFESGLHGAIHILRRRQRDLQLDALTAEGPERDEFCGLRTACTLLEKNIASLPALSEECVMPEAQRRMGWQGAALAATAALRGEMMAATARQAGGDGDGKEIAGLALALKVVESRLRPAEVPDVRRDESG